MAPLLKNVRFRMMNENPPDSIHISPDSTVNNLKIENLVAERPGRIRRPRYLLNDDNFTNSFDESAGVKSFDMQVIEEVELP